MAIRVAAEADRPEVLLTGDTLFAGSIGRTDLPGGSTSQELGSIHDRLLTRPDGTVVLPGHGPSSTIGAERAGNPFLTRQHWPRLGTPRAGRTKLTTCPSPDPPVDRSDAGGAETP